MTSKRWSEKYRPLKLDDILGNEKAVSDLRGWARSWETGSPQVNGAIIYGPAGVGKTSAALALATEMGWDMIEMNASDQRTAGTIQSVAFPAARDRTFSGKRRLVILDEADNLHGNYDRGGAAAMLKLVKTTNQPILLIANEYYEIEKPLRDACQGIQFRSIRSGTIAGALTRIASSEGITADPQALMKIAETASGDLRSAINDLQAAAEGLTHLSLQDVATAERDVKSSIFRVLDVIFRGGSTNEALQASRTLDENPEDLVHWIDENIPIAYKGNDLYTAFESLSRADVFLGRVSRRQNYGLWRYAGFFMTAGVAACRTSRGSGYIAFKPPSLWRRIGQTRRARGVRDSAARKLARHVHVGTSYARCELMEFAGMLLASKEIAPAVAASLELDAEEIALLIGSSSSTKKVQSIFEEASRIREAERISDIESGWSLVPAHGMHSVAGELGGALVRKGDLLEHPVQAVRIDAKSEPEGKGIAEHSAVAPSTKQDEAGPGASNDRPLPEAKAKRKPGRPRKSESKAKADGAAKRQRSLFEF